MEQPKFKVGDEVYVRAYISRVHCVSEDRGWMYDLKIKGLMIEQCWMMVEPTVHEASIFSLSYSYPQENK